MSKDGVDTIANVIPAAKARSFAACENPMLNFIVFP